MRAFAGLIDSMVRRGPRPGSVEAYGVALACVLAATLLRLLIDMVSPGAVPFVTFFPALLIATLVGGAAAGIVTTLLGAVLSWWLFIEPRFTWVLADKNHVVSVLLYLFAGGLIVWAANQYRLVVARIDEEEKYRRIVVDELSHRVKNKLATIYAILRHELREQPDIWDSVSGRLQALSTADDLLNRGENGGVSLQQILTTEMAPFGDGRIGVDGPEVDLFGKLPTVVALIIHELATNAAKYGALSRAGGHVSAAVRQAGDTIEIVWRERGGPAVATPSRRSFGSKLIERSLDSFGGSARLEFNPDGVVCRIVLPGTHASVREGGAAPAALRSWGQ
jgi:two-component sensor histidine kinase